MASIGLRQLRQRASEYDGRVTPPRGDLLALGAPLKPRRRLERPSVTLERARARERQPVPPR